MKKISPERYKMTAKKLSLALCDAGEQVSNARWLIDERLYQGTKMYEAKAREQIKKVIPIVEDAIKKLKELDECVIDYEDLSELNLEY